MLAIPRKSVLRIGLMAAIVLVVLLAGLFYFTQQVFANHAETAPPGCFLADAEGDLELWVCEGEYALYVTDGDYCVIGFVFYVGDGHEPLYGFPIAQECGATGTPPSPGIWLADVCEPNDGFSPDDWTTVDSNANTNNAFGTKLYVAASPEGPWFETEFLQPPYVISHAQMEALAAMVGAPDIYGLWMRPGEGGIPANYGSMVEDREAHMAELCGTE